MPVPYSRLGRACGLALAFLISVAAVLVGTSASASAIPGNFSVDGSAFINGDRPMQATDSLFVFLYVGEPADENLMYAVNTSAVDGTFSFDDVGDGDYTVVVRSFDAEFPVQDPSQRDVVVEGGDLTLAPFVLDADPRLSGGRIAVTGSSVVGGTLVAAVSATTGPDGGSVDADVDLSWGYSRGDSVVAIDGASAPTLVLPEGAAGSTVVYSGYASAPGYRPTLLRSNEIVVTAPAQIPVPARAALPAPVADSTGLAAFLRANSVEKMSAADAGVPASVSPSTSQVVAIGWGGLDTYVDVYAYSTPRYIGTFPVVGGQVQLTLSPSVLAALGAGAHTLVYTGQSSGAVQAVAFAVSPALASTGVAAPAWSGLAGGLLVLGLCLLLSRRRSGAEHGV